MQRRKKRGSLIVQVAALFGASVLIIGMLTFFAQRLLSYRSIRKQVEFLASETAANVMESVWEYPASDWLIHYWYTHADDLDIEYDVDYGPGTETEEKVRLFSERHPDIQLKYASGEQVASLPQEDQKLYAEITYSWLITRINQIKKTYNIDFVFCVLSQEPYTDQFFLFSAADEDSVRGTEYENAYILGTRATVGGSQQQAMRNAREKRGHLADAGLYADYYAYMGMEGEQDVIIGLTFNMTGLRSNITTSTKQGTGVAVAVLFFVAVKRKKLAEWMLSVFMISVGLFAMSLLDKSKKGNRGHLNGIAELVGNPKIMGAFLILSGVVSAVLIFIKLKKTAFYDRIQNKWLMIGVTAAGLMAVAAFVIIGIRNKNELFVFNNRWGEFRGYIWSRSWRVFGKADIGHKLFGYGNETVRDIMLTNYHQEMIDVTKKVYDSCHNILLQRLLTTGIFGLVTFVTLFGSSVRYMFKYSQGRAEIFACAAGASAYFAEAMVNPEQPITTPLFYVLLAVGVGLARYGRTKEKNKE